MLIIDKIYSNNTEFSTFMINTENLINYMHGVYVELSKEVLTNLNSTRIDLYDTASKYMIKDVKLSDIDSIMHNIYGVVSYYTSTIFIGVSKACWNFLDIVNEVSVCACPRVRNVTNEGMGYTVFDGKTAIFIIAGNFEILDDNMVFWRNSRKGLMTILDIYEYVFTRGLAIRPDMQVYLQSEQSFLIKLDTNSEVIRFMSKYITLRR